MLVYRYIFVFLNHAVEIASAQRSRLGYCGLHSTVSSIGTLAGNIVTRSLEQARRTHEAMTARCYCGKIPISPITVWDDIAFGPRNLGYGEDEVERRIDQSLELVGATKLRDRAIHQLSFGEQKRISIAGVLAMKPSILILDEPTAGLDPQGEAHVMQLLGCLNRRHDLTVVIATHCPDLLPLFTDRIYVLKQGRVLGHGTAGDIFSNQIVIDNASLRLPYIAELIRQMKQKDGIKINGLPLTVREARRKLLALIPIDSSIDRQETRQ